MKLLFSKILMFSLISNYCFAENCKSLPIPTELTSLNCRAFNYQQACSQLCVISTNEESHWFLFSPHNYTLKLEITSSFLNVTDFQISPNQQWLAVASIGEGHPALDIFPLPPLLAQQTAEARYNINPYPGSVDIEQWQDATHLQINTDRWLPYNAPLRDEYSAIFVLNVETGEYSTEDKTLQNPIEYYKDWLKTVKNEWDKQQILEILTKLQPAPVVPSPQAPPAREGQEKQEKNGGSSK